jgi:hypothetical protein
MPMPLSWTSGGHKLGLTDPLPDLSYYFNIFQKHAMANFFPHGIGSIGAKIEDTMHTNRISETKPAEDRYPIE